MARGFGYKVFIVPIYETAINYGVLSGFQETKNALGASGFIDNTPGTLQLAAAKVSARNIASTIANPFYISVGEVTMAISNAALVSNVATITVPSHTITVGSRVTVSGLTSTFAPLNGNWLISAVTSTTISWAQTNANITTGAATGVAVAGTDLKLDGTDKPFRLLGLESGAPDQTVSSETNPTWDDETQGAVVSEPVSSATKISFKGKTNYNDSAYKILRIVQNFAVSKGLAAKIAKIGPTGYTETVFGFGRFVGFKPEDDAGKIVKWTSDFEFDGPAGLILHE